MKTILAAVIACAIVPTVFGQTNSLSNLMATRTRDVAPPTCDDARRALADAGTPAPTSKLPLSHFGAGLAAVSNLGDDRVTDAAVVNGKIAVLSDENALLGAVLEAHALSFTIKSKPALTDSKGRLYVLEDEKKDIPCQAVSAFPTVAHGPFVVTRVGDNEIVKSVGAGWMMGFRMRESATSLNIGVAYTIETGAKQFATGFQEGQPLPTGETTIRYRTGRGSALTFVTSFGF